MSEEFEELEQIPWAALAATPNDNRARYFAIAIAVSAVLAVVAWLLLRDSTPPVAVPSSLPAPTTSEALTVETSPPDVVSPAVYSEADLMLVNVGDEERLAVMQAEWLIRDLLTVDGDPEIESRIATLLPDHAREDDREDAATYVEWVEAFSVASSEPGRYEVEVLYSLLLAEEDGFVRQPPGALAVELAVDVDGSATILSAPSAVPVPVLHPIER